jgi:hypothetical protein
MAAINSAAKASTNYGPLQTSALSDEANTTVTSRKKKVLRRAGAVNYDEDNDSDEEIDGS